MTTSTEPMRALPHWDMTVVYPSIDSPEFEEGFQSAIDAIDSLRDLFDKHEVARQVPGPLNAETVEAFDAIINRYNDVQEQVATLRAYLEAFTATNSRDNLAQAKLSELQGHLVKLSQLGTRLVAWIGSLDTEALVQQSQLAREHKYFLERSKTRASHQMSPPEESLAAELNLNSGSAWNKLHNNVTSQLMVPVDIEGYPFELPMSVVRTLASESDREVRRKAYEAELQGWAKVAVPLAAALNSIKGEVNTLSKRRGWDSALDEALFDSAIDHETLDAMLQAATESFPDFRRYLQAKARVLGTDRLAWYDIFAPVGESTKVWEYDEAKSFIVEQFGTYSQKMSDFAARAFSENWIDAEPRMGKRDGAFCMPLRKDESRVMANYKPAYGGMSTLAHELGHGYHNLIRSVRTPIQRSTPMTLAETASIFCETIVRNAAMRDADRAEQLSILEASLQDSTQVVVDISSRFLFESRVFEKRRQRELSVDEFNTLMLQAQKETYGDGLDPDALHEYMWAMKPHYYRTGLSFYNFPYMFGLLFGLGLYSRYKQDHEAFTKGYNELLSSTGLADAATLAARFGIDVRTPDFWRSSLAIIKEDIDRFEQLTA